MATTSKQITAMAEARSVTREETKPLMRDEAAILGEIVDRMSVIEAKQARPSPVQLRSWEEIERFAEKAARSGMVPKDFIGKPDAICIAVMMGGELGLAPIQSLQNIAVVNGRPSIWGDAMPALCRASGVVRSIREWSSGEDDSLTFYCEAIRKDDPNPIVGKFSVLDAKRAKLWQENPTVMRRGRDGSNYQADSGPWYSYPHRMLQMRARGFALRDAFPDVLRGLISVEEAADIPFEATGLTPRVEVHGKPDPSQAQREGAVEGPEPTWLEQLDEKLSSEPDGNKWLEMLNAEVSHVPTKDDAESIGGLASIAAAYTTAPTKFQARINDILRKAIAKFDEPIPDPDFMDAQETA